MYVLPVSIEIEPQELHELGKAAAVVSSGQEGSHGLKLSLVNDVASSDDDVSKPRTLQPITGQRTVSRRRVASLTRLKRAFG